MLCLHTLTLEGPAVVISACALWQIHQVYSQNTQLTAVQHNSILYVQFEETNTYFILIMRSVYVLLASSQNVQAVNCRRSCMPKSLYYTPKYT